MGDRPTNQDVAYAGPWLAAVAEGSGPGGEVAAAAVVHALARLDTSERPGDPIDTVRGALDDAQQRIGDIARRSPRYAGMAAMLTALLSAGNHLVLAHLGTGCAYMLRADELYRITPEEPTGCVLGYDPADLPPAQPGPQGQLDAAGDRCESLRVTLRQAHVGDRYLLCPYPVAALVDDHSKYGILTRHRQPSAAARHIIAQTIRVENQPALTCVVVDVVQQPPHQAPIMLSGT